MRIAKDVLSAGAATKMCLPEGPEEFARALIQPGRAAPRRGGGRPGPAAGGGPAAPASGRWPDAAVAGAGGRRPGAGPRPRRAGGRGGRGAGGARRRRAPPGPAGGRQRRCGAGRAAHPVRAARPAAAPARCRPGLPASRRPHPWLRTCQSLVRTLARPAGPGRPLPDARCAGPLRGCGWRSTGCALVDLDQPVEDVSVTPGAAGTGRGRGPPGVGGGRGGPAPADRAPASRSPARTSATGRTRWSRGPVRTRTWTVREAAWGLTLPAG